MAREAGILEALLQGSGPLEPDWVGPGDDCCVLPAGAGEQRLCLSVDALEEGVHFHSHWQPLPELGRRLLATCLSDLAACGAEPLGYLLAVGWPEARTASDAAELAAALREAELDFSCPLLGGDTDVRSGPLRLEATVLGRVEEPLLRSGARAGDHLFVSGPLGAAAAVVAMLLAGETLAGRDANWRDAERRFRRPEPRLDLGRRLRGRAHAVIDLSDGLLEDAGHLASASRLDVHLDAERVPVHPAADLELALGGGEDYELLVAGPASLTDDFPELLPVGRLEPAAEATGQVRLGQGASR